MAASSGCPFVIPERNTNFPDPVLVFSRDKFATARSNRRPPQQKGRTNALSLNGRRNRWLGRGSSRQMQLLIFILQLVKLPVESALHQQFLMAAHLAQLPLVHHQKSYRPAAPWRAGAQSARSCAPRPSAPAPRGFATRCPCLRLKSPRPKSECADCRPSARAKLMSCFCPVEK